MVMRKVRDRYCGPEEGGKGILGQGRDRRGGGGVWRWGKDMRSKLERRGKIYGNNIATINYKDGAYCYFSLCYGHITPLPNIDHSKGPRSPDQDIYIYIYR